MTQSEKSNSEHPYEMTAMLLVSFVVVSAVSVLAAFIDLSAEQSVKISIAYVIMGGMLVNKFIPLGRPQP